MLAILTLCIILLLPGILLWSEQHVKLIAWLSPAFFCYALGILLGNILPLSAPVLEQGVELSVALAIPMLLFSANLKNWLRLAPVTLISYTLWLLAVLLSCGLAFWAYQSWFAQADLATAMAGSVYTGGTANMAAVHLALGATDQFFGEMNLSDLMVSGLLLIFVLTLFHRLLAAFLPRFKSQGGPMAPTLAPETPAPIHWLGVAGSIGWGLLCLGLVAGLNAALMGKLDSTFMMVGLTLMGLLASRWEKIRHWPMSYATGQYIFLVFCVAVGAQVQLDAILGGTLRMLGFMAIAAYGAVLIHTIMARVAGVDADTALITHIAGVFGPPFVGPVAQVMHNREIVVSGMTLSVINLAVGNFMGLFLYEFIQWIGT